MHPFHQFNCNTPQSRFHTSIDRQFQGLPAQRKQERLSHPDKSRSSIGHEIHEIEAVSLSPSISALCFFYTHIYLPGNPFRSEWHGRQPPGTLNLWPVSHKAPLWQVKKNGQCILPLICSLTSANDLLGGNRIWPRGKAHAGHAGNTSSCKHESLNMQNSVDIGRIHFGRGGRVWSLHQTCCSMFLSFFISGPAHLPLLQGLLPARIPNSSGSSPCGDQKSRGN